MTDEQFDIITANCRPHEVFCSEWGSFYPDDFADTLLPKAGIIKGKSLRFYDGAGIVPLTSSFPQHYMKLSTNDQIVSLIFFSYPKGVTAGKKADGIRPGHDELWIHCSTYLSAITSTGQKASDAHVTALQNELKEMKSGTLPAKEEYARLNISLFSIKQKMNNAMKYFFPLFLLSLLYVSCSSSTDNVSPKNSSIAVQPLPKMRYTIPAIKDIIDNSIELPEFPYYATFFDTIVPKLIEDTNFIEFILENRESYYDTTGNRHYLHSEKYIYCDTAKIRHNIYTDDVATSGFAEYGWVNGSLKLENPYKVFDCGKLSKENMIFLFIRIYDLESHIYYLFSFDKNYNFLSSICLYGYPVFDYDKFCETGELNEKKISNSFLNYSFDGSNLRLNIEDCNNNYIYYFFKIDEEGFFILHDIIHIYEEGGTHWEI